VIDKLHLGDIIGDIDAFDVVVGSLRSTAGYVVSFPHRWTAEGVTVEARFVGAYLLHLAVAGCVLHDVYREAERLRVAVDGVRVTAMGEFDTTWRSAGISYVVVLDSSASIVELDALLEVVDSVAEIPKSIRAGARMGRVPV